MKKNNINSVENQEQRLRVKGPKQQLQNIVVEGTGMSPWEAQVLVDTVEEVYMSDPTMQASRPGQVKYLCVSSEEGPGKALKKCKMVSVILTLFEETDKEDLSLKDNNDKSAEIRRRRLARIAEEAKEQGGLLSQEDLAELLMCDVRTVRRDMNELKKIGVILPTRGQQKDIGPGVTHRAIAVQLWLEGKEPVEVANHIKHSINAVENYLQKFKRIVYLKRKNFDKHEIAMTIGASLFAVETFIDIYKKFKNKSFFKQRIQEIELIGAQYHNTSHDEKKTQAQENCIDKEWRKP